MSDAFDARTYLENYDGPDFRIMEVCGTHTHEIFRQGIRKILSPKIRLISGPGCPVCVTPVSFIDEAVYLALEKGCTITTFGDLVRVPGTKMSLAGARAKGANIKVVYSPSDAVKYAASHTDEQVVFLSGGALLESGPIEKVLRDPDRAETRQFLEFYGFTPEPRKEG